MNRSKIITSALSYYGLNETYDGKVNPKLLHIINEVSEVQVKNNIPWCTAFVSYILKINRHEYSKKLNARSYLELGRKVVNPEIGQIAVLWRESLDSWKGHVGFFISETKNKIYLLGGNQNNTVCIKSYPKQRLLSYLSIEEKRPMTEKKIGK